MSRAAATPELLSPAGDWSALRAAAANGADAVYFGLSNFNARHRASNFELAELPEVMRYLRERQVRGYVTLNTLLFSDELPEVAEFIAAIARAGVDAIIVQDLGVAALAKRIAPALPIHGSTQMTLTEPLGIEFVRELGVERVIVARELGIADIEQITQGTSLPLEVFVHGALCVAYSGQCLTSEALGGRSANRGQCAQACRLPYDLFVDGEHRELGDRSYLLSPQDLAAYDLVGDLAKLGVASLKIEGRLKSAEYVAITTQTYRSAIDAAASAQEFTLSADEERELAQSFSRGFSHGFLSGINHQVLVEGRFPKSRGVRVGRVVGRTRSGVIVAFEGDFARVPLQPGDGVVFDQGHPEQDEQGGRVYSVDLLPDEKSLRAEVRFAREAVNLAAIESGALVWKTDDPALRKRLQRTFADERPARRRKLEFQLSGEIGGELTLAAECENIRGAKCRAEASWPGPLQLAEKRPLTLEVAREQLGRLGETIFDLGDVRLEVDSRAMVPKSVLNELRRQVVAQAQNDLEASAAIDRIDVSALGEWRAEIRARRGKEEAGPPALRVLVRTMEQLATIAEARDELDLAGVYCDFEDVRRYGDAVALARSANLTVGVATLRIMKPSEAGLLRQILRSEPDEILVRNLGALSFFREASPEIPLIGDFSLNVANELSADLMLAAGLARITPSYDLNWEQFEALARNSAADRFEVVIHQHLPMFHMEHCVFAALLSEGKDWRDCGRPCDHHRIELRDRVGAPFPVLADTGCRNTVYNAVAQSAAEYIPRMRQFGIRAFRIELLREEPAEIRGIVGQYARVISGEDTGRGTWRQLRVLNQLGVTRGTLRQA